MTMSHYHSSSYLLLGSGQQYSTFAYIGMAGLSLASVYGAVTFWKHWKVVGRSWIEEISNLRQSLGDAETEKQKKDGTITQLRRELERGVQKLLGLETQLDAAKKENVKLADRVRILGDEVQQLSEVSQRARIEHTQTLELLETRTAELKGAQAFLTKADHVSGADVIKMIDVLNSEILQTAAFMAESFVFPEKSMAKEGEEEEEESVEMKEACNRAAEILGTRIVGQLKTVEHHEDPTLVQIAFQSSMAAYTHWIISSWYFEDPEDEHLLNEIYARVRETEEQAVSGRWRALTRVHAQRMLKQIPDLSIYIVDAFTNVLIAAGIKDDPSSLHNQIMKDFSGRIAIVLQAAQRLNKVIGEGITSCDLEALYIAPDVGYDPTTMEDGFEGAQDGVRPQDDEPVLCTTDLGLVRAEKKTGTVGEWNEAVLLKPKVVLPSGLVLK